MTIKIDGYTRLFPIIGDPIVYARSPELLSTSFAAQGANAVCVPMQVPSGCLSPVMAALTETPNVDGILVTMPHKNEVLDHCATLSDASRLLGAVSVIRRNADGTWHGDSQDGASFVKAQIDHGAQPEGAKVLLLGAGGAGGAIAISLLQAGVAELIIYDTDRSKAEKLVEMLTGYASGDVRYGPPDPTGCAMLCNATPMGMADSDPIPVDPALLTSGLFVGDVIAGHGETKLIKAARAAGCGTATGDQMVEAVQTMMVDYMLGR